MENDSLVQEDDDIVDDDDEDTMDHDAARRRRKRDENNLTVSHGGPMNGSNGVKKKGHRRRRNKKEETLSLALVMQVGASLLVLCGVLYLSIPWMFPSLVATEDDGYYEMEQEAKIAATPAPTSSAKKVKATAPPLPVWELGPNAKYDAYGLAKTLSSSNKKFWNEAAALREDFSSRYGGENAARSALERGLSTFGIIDNSTNNKDNTYPSDLVHTACRIQEVAHEKAYNKTFSMAFGGYSVTAGRGNFFEQSFPFVLENILKRAFRLLGISLVVRNAAIGGVPSFPYGWCMSNFWGPGPQVVSWDYSMNEAGGVPGGLEAYLRHVTVLGHNPKLIVKDTHMAKERRDLLRSYVQTGSILDPVVIHTDPAVKYFLDLAEDFRPEGYQEWRRFGAPKGVPGQSQHHPAVKEHAFIAWILAMHFLSAMELVAAAASSDNNVNLDCSSLQKSDTPPNLPAPTSVLSATSWMSVLFGEASKGETVWKMNPTFCRTSFEPILDGDITSIVVSGTAGQDVDLMLPKGPMYYNKGWVMDISDKEKKAKRKLDRYGRLGFVDSKKALYGIFASGPLRLLLPYETKDNKKPQVGDDAQSWYKSIVVCQVNEKREDACEPETDMKYVVGGTEAINTTLMDSDGTLYLGNKICMHVPVPNGATISSRKAILQNSTRKLDEEDGSTVFLEEEDNDDRPDAVGLSVEISVTNIRIHERQKACSVSHVVWEQVSR